MTMIQDITPHRYSNAWNPRSPRKDDLIFWYQGNDTYLRNDDRIYTYQDIPPELQCTYLFDIDHRACYVADLSGLPGSHPVPLRSMRSYPAGWLGFACVTGAHLFSWISQNHYCGRCGTPLIRKEKERAFICPDCSHVVYPRINPAVIVGVINEKQELLVTRYARRNVGAALVAGYTEIGETIEETVIREVKEETGLSVKNLRYYGSQPWAFSQTILLGFWCEVDGSDVVTLEENELSEAVWLKPENIEDPVDHASLTATMIQAFKDGRI